MYQRCLQNTHPQKIHKAGQDTKRIKGSDLEFKKALHLIIARRRL
jgi:hypothetical protein